MKSRKENIYKWVENNTRENGSGKSLI